MAQHSIVRGTRATHAGVLFMMSHDDFRFARGDYMAVTGGRLAKARIDVDGRRCRVFDGLDGHLYAVFVDWSARLLTANEVRH